MATQVASQAQLGTAFVLQMSASMGREIGGLVGAGAAVADALAFIAQPANDLSSQLTSDERCRGWKVRMDISLVHAEHRASATQRASLFWRARGQDSLP
jgi:hypothetical protein